MDSPDATQAPERGADELARHRESREADDLRNVWRVAGVLYIGGALTSFPSTLLLENDPLWIAIGALTLATIALGCLCLWAAERHLSRGWLQPAIALGTLCVALAAALAEPRYEFYYVFVAVFIGYASRRRDEFIAQLLLIAAAVLSPLVYEDGGAQENLRYALLAIPGLIFAALVVRHLRTRVERRERTVIEFAEEAMALADRVLHRGNGSAGLNDGAEAATPSAQPDGRPERSRRRAARPTENGSR